MIKINKEFIKLIPVLSVEEFKQLEANCLEDGIMNPLVLWNDFIIDGHNRYQIALMHELKFDYIDMEFEDEDAVKMWIINNQLGRRNINSYQRSVLALAYESMFSKKAKANLEESGKQSTNLINRSLPTLANSDEPPASMALPTLSNLGLAPIDTREEIAKIANVSHGTIDKVKTIEAHATPEMKLLLSSGEMSINKAFHGVQEFIEVANIIDGEIQTAVEISGRVIQVDNHNEILEAAKEIRKQRKEETKIERKIENQNRTTPVINPYSSFIAIYKDLIITIESDYNLVTKSEVIDYLKSKIKEYETN
jgi:hypothetical protein